MSFQAARDAFQDTAQHSSLWIFIGQDSILDVCIPCIPHHTTSDASPFLIRVPFVSLTIRNFTGLPTPRPEPAWLP
ncbi:hypothetical protein, partial [Deinococcus sp.]|uniref:hypothetical protein n=1 Tax=Deinococcus sp. TaxID=47478 RepID=UPI00391ABA82